MTEEMKSLYDMTILYPKHLFFGCKIKSSPLRSSPKAVQILFKISIIYYLNNFCINFAKYY